MTKRKLFNFGIPFQQDGKTWLATVLAENEGQALDLLWEKVMEDSPLLDDTSKPILAGEITNLGPGDEVPFPEALPDGPAVLAVMRLEKRPQ